MFVMYVGNGKYDISFGHKTVELETEEIAEIQNFNFMTNKPTIGVEELEDKIENLQNELSELEEMREHDIGEIDALHGQIRELELNSSHNWKIDYRLTTTYDYSATPYFTMFIVIIYIGRQGRHSNIAYIESFLFYIGNIK